MSMKATKLCSLLLAVLTAGCSPRIVETVRTEIEYRDRVVHDTTKVEIPYEVEKIVTRDTASHLENSYAKSDAVVSGGFLSHSLESIPQTILVPVEVKVTDTLWRESKEAQTEKLVEVEKPLTWWQKFRLRAFWWLLGGVACAAVWIFRKPVLSVLKRWMP